MPGCAVDPHTHNHRRHPIDVHDNHGNLDRIDDVSPADDHEHDLADGIADVDQPVTVADLLDAHEALSDVDYSDDRWTVYEDAYDAAPGHVRASFERVSCAIADLADLSPEERAEFDRRTT